MAKIEDMKEIANKLIAEAKKEKINISNVYLFGSYAKGNAHEYSDIDFAVISDDLQGIRYFDNLRLSAPKLRTNTKLELHPYRSENFNESNPFVKEILSYGIRLV